MEVAMRVFLVIVAILAGIFPALAEHTSFLLTNKSPVNITQVYATSVVNKSFGYDLLDSNEVIRPGQVKLISPRDNRGCLFDVAFRFEGGHSVNRRKLNLCEITTLSTTGQGVGVPNRNERPRTYQDFQTRHTPVLPRNPDHEEREPILREIPAFTRGTQI
jgi:hypothetical protein